MGQFYVKLGADITQFQSKMQQATKSLEKTGKKMQNIGKNMSMYVTAPLVALAVQSTKAFTELEGVKTAFDRLNKPGLLENLQSSTKNTVSNLELMKAAVRAENFKIPLNELGTLLEFAQRRAKDTGESVDYLVNSIVMGIGRKSPLILDNLGISAISLKDKLGGVSAASASIGDVTQAVGQIAREELAKMGEDVVTFGEQLDQLQASYQNLSAEIGGIIAKSIKPFIDNIKLAVLGFQKLKPAIKENAVLLAGAFAVTGPILVGIGFLVTTLIPSMIAGFTALVSPIALVVASFAALAAFDIWFNENKTALLLNMAEGFMRLRNSAIQAMQDIVIAAAPLLDLFGFDTNGILGKLGELKKVIKDFAPNIKSFGEVFDITLEKIKNKVLGTSEAISGTPKSLEGAITKAGNAASNASGANALGKTDFSNGYKTSPFANIRSPQQIQMDSDLEIAENLLYSVNDGFKNINKSTVKSGRSMADFSSGMDDMVRLLESNLTQLFGSGAGGTGGLFGKLFGIIGGIIGGPAGTIVGGAVGGIFDELAGAGGSFDNDVNFKKLRGGNNSTNINVTGRLVGDDIVFLYDDVKEKQKRYF